MTIARIVGVNPSNVCTYRSRILSKLENGNVIKLVRFAIRHRLIRP